MSRSGKRASVYICQERFLKGPRSLDLVQEVLAFVLFCFSNSTHKTWTIFFGLLSSRQGGSSLGFTFHANSRPGAWTLAGWCQASPIL